MTVKKVGTLHIVQIGPEVYKIPARPSPADSVVIRRTSDGLSASKVFFKYLLKDLQDKPVLEGSP